MTSSILPRIARGTTLSTLIGARIAHGDAIRWLTDSERLGFIEAVRQLSDAAGMTMPEDGPIISRRGLNLQLSARKQPTRLAHACASA